MRTPIRFVASFLLAFLLLPQALQAGGGGGEDPYEIGEKLLSRKNYRTALTYYRKALRRDDRRAHYGAGLIYEETGKKSEAVSHYRLFIAHGSPEDPRRSDAMRRVEAIEERQESEAGRTADLLERGKALFKSRNYREAEKVLRQAISRDESKAEAHFLLGEVYLQLEEYDKAKAEYRKAKQRY